MPPRRIGGHSVRLVITTATGRSQPRRRDPVVDGTINRDGVDGFDGGRELAHVPDAGHGLVEPGDLGMVGAVVDDRRPGTSQRRTVDAAADVSRTTVG